MYRCNSKTKGFTLVELSIVIIIIGFLIAGISAGSSLIQSSKLNATINIERQLEQAIYTFKATYGFLPGDFPYASDYWPSSYCIPGDTNVQFDNCNGNGNGIWDEECANACSGAIGSANASAEGFMGLQHLQSAAMLTGGNYRGGGGAAFRLGINAVPVPLHSNIGLQLNSTGGQVLPQFPTGSFLAVPFYNINGNYIILQGEYPGNTQPGNSAATPIEASNIDAKIDDGFPSTGSTLSYTGYSNVDSCTTTVGGQLVYNLSDPNLDCVIGFFVPSN